MSLDELRTNLNRARGKPSGKPGDPIVTKHGDVTYYTINLDDVPGGHDGWSPPVERDSDADIRRESVNAALAVGPSAVDRLAAMSDEDRARAEARIDDGMSG